MLIKNGFLIDPASDTERLVDLRITDGLIQTLADAGTLTPENGEDELDAAGLMISPGLVDTHIHFRDPGFTYKEDLHTGSLAAAAGGFTSVICMANTSPVIDSVPVLKELMEREALEDIHIFQAAAVSCGLKGEEMTSMKELAAAGACGFTDDGIPLKNAAFLYKAMEEAKALDLPISLHEEDPAFIETNGINHGPVSDALGIYGSPSIAEESLVARDCLLALRSGAQVVIQHISSGQSVELVRTFKAMGANLHAEATPHHFTLTDEAVLKYGALAKMNPPLRTENDRLAIIEGLKDGTIDLIATDHAPHTNTAKTVEFDYAPFGIIGLETAVQICLTELYHKQYLDLPALISKFTKGPADVLGMPIGTLENGRPADITILDPEKEGVVDADKFYSKSRNTPFNGYRYKGLAVGTIVDGKCVFSLLDSLKKE